MPINGSPPREPELRTVPIVDLRPTQMTIGMREVAAKRKFWRQKAAGKSGGAEFLGKHMIPVVLGPKGRSFLIDHHHLARALLDEGVISVLITVVADLSRLDRDCFWFVLDCRNYVHPFDADGKRRDIADLPKSVADLVDDPFRSLAGALRRQGGYAKDTTPFSEFLWADFLRRRLKRGEVEADFDAALKQAVEAAKSREADYLPGWCGPIDNS